ncbi:MAG: dimethyl sulfoxide reductase anchor subunit [Gammaproteobacteria bacterium]|nr:dimethyl sulfoxide reductase anchor subunit [Gammaproteobacteria bacterium]
MHPAFSVVFLTTLIGAGQGLFLALYTGESYSVLNLLPPQNSLFYTIGSLVAFVLLVTGLLASFFHLGHPERAWRAAARWRTSWLSREVIVLPIVIGGVFVYGVLHHLGWELSLFGIQTNVRGDLTLVVGAFVALATFALFLCTGMIYACIKFIQEWHSSLTVINYLLLGTASGFVLATAFSTYGAPDLVNFYGVWAMIITVSALATRAASLIRNAHLKQRSSMRTAIGVRHSHISQRSMGAMGGSFNTREFFHGAPMWLFRSIKWVFLVLVFPVPLLLLYSGMSSHSPVLLYSAFVIQYIGLLAERWFFFAQANHPQNLYYQTIG